MADYIERQAAIIQLSHNKSRGDDEWELAVTSDMEIIRTLPSADAAPVVHGKWIDEDPAFAEYFANCSVCCYEIDVHNERGYFNFCPNCGAKMDGGDEHG